MIRVTSPRLVYQLLRQILAMLTQLARDRGATDVELLALRHEAALLHRQVRHPKPQPTDRVVPAALSRLLPRQRWSAFSSRRRPCCAGTDSCWHGTGPTRTVQQFGR